MRIALVLLLFWPLALFAVDRTLSDCTIGGTPTEIAPLDLDDCAIEDGDDITGILTGLATTYDDVYVRAPSETLGVTFTGTVEFGPAGQGAYEFVFLENEVASNRLTITHVPDTEDAQMWKFTNMDRIVIGGPNLGVTLVGTRPGIGRNLPCSGTKESCNEGSRLGLLAINLNDGSSPALADIRANIAHTWGAGVLFLGNDVGNDGELTTSRWQQVNIAGLYVNASLEINSGVQKVWLDPDRTWFMDPWVRATGWDGGIAKTHNGDPVGCFNEAKALQRNAVGAGIQGVRELTGGATAEYGFPIMNIFYAKYVGSENAPYIVRLKDWGHSGPESITGYPSGVMVKHGVAGGPLKHDPMPAEPYGITSTARYIRFIQLPSDYGMGQYTPAIESGCAVGNSTDNNWGSGYPFLYRAEASHDGQCTKFETAFIRAEFAGITSWKTGGDASTYVQAAQGVQYCPPYLDRIHNIILRAADDTDMPGYTQILDTSTITGPGSWLNIVITGFTTTGGTPTTVSPVDNTITDTHVRGLVTVGGTATGTTISNVDFTPGGAREIINVGTGASITASNWCVTAGSTIAGGGSVVYEGTTWTTPHTISSAMSECSITADPRPGPVTGGGVQ